METITRKAAKSAGLKHYFTGKPCSRGHIDTRYVASFGCKTCIRENVLKHFWNLTPEKREARREHERRKWRNPESRARAQAYHSRPIELEKQRVRNREWKKANRSSCTDRQNKRNATLYSVFIEDVSLEFLFERDRGRCQLCGRDLSLTTQWPHPRTPTRDHTVPLSKGGTHERSNLQLACAECNVRKGAKVA